MLGESSWVGRSPQARRPPPDQADTPKTRQTPPSPGQGDPPGPGRPPWDQADTPPPQGSRLQNTSTSGRYTSYWNAFLYLYKWMCLFSLVSFVWVHAKTSSFVFTEFIDKIFVKKCCFNLLFLAVADLHSKILDEHQKGKVMIFIKETMLVYKSRGKPASK